MKTKIIYTAIVAALLAGCQSESSSVQSTPEPEPTPAPAPKPEPLPQKPQPEPIPTPEPKPDPIPTPPPSTPIFVPEGISTITQQPYSGTVIRGGDAYLRYDAGITDFQDFEVPEWSVQYKYQPYLEVLITNSTETLCARYSWKLEGFGYAKPNCLWSDVRAALPLQDMKAAYYGYSVVESRVWVNGVVGLGIEIN